MRRLLVLASILALGGCVPKAPAAVASAPAGAAATAKPHHHLFHRHRLDPRPFPAESVSLPSGTIGVVRVTRRQGAIALIDIEFPIDFAIDSTDVAAGKTTKQTRLPVSIAGPLVLFDQDGRFAELGVQSGFQLVFWCQRGSELHFRPMLHTTLPLADVEHALGEGHGGVAGFAVVADPKPIPSTRAGRKMPPPAIVPDLPALPADSTDRALLVGRVDGAGVLGVALDYDPEGDCGPETLLVRTSEGDAELSCCAGDEEDATAPTDAVSLADETHGGAIRRVETRSVAGPGNVPLVDGSIGIVRVLARYGNTIDAEVVFGSDWTLKKPDGSPADYSTTVPVDIAGPLTIFDAGGPIARGTVTSADLTFWCDRNGVRHWRPVARVSIDADSVERPVAARDGTRGVAGFALVGPPGSAVSVAGGADLEPLAVGKVGADASAAILFTSEAAIGCEAPVLRTADGDLELECCGK